MPGAPPRSAEKQSTVALSGRGECIHDGFYLSVIKAINDGERVYEKSIRERLHSHNSREANVDSC
jgi:hypothetical protein